MEDFNYRGKTVVFWETTGIVLGTDKYSETHISSSGGGGYVGPHGGHVSGPTVSSRTVTNHEFWIKKEDGSEQDIQLRGVDIPLRPGQKITIISSKLKDANSGWYTALVNHNAKKYWQVSNSKELNQLLRLEVVTFKSLLIAITLLPLVYFLSHSVPAALSAATAFIIYRFFLKNYRMNKIHKSLNSHIEKIAKISIQSD